MKQHIKKHYKLFIVAIGLFLVAAGYVGYQWYYPKAAKEKLLIRKEQIRAFLAKENINLNDFDTTQKKDLLLALDKGYIAILKETNQPPRYLVSLCGELEEYKDLMEAYEYYESLIIERNCQYEDFKAFKKEKYHEELKEAKDLKAFVEGEINFIKSVIDDIACNMHQACLCDSYGNIIGLQENLDRTKYAAQYKTLEELKVKIYDLIFRQYHTLDSLKEKQQETQRKIEKLCQYEKLTEDQERELESLQSSLKSIKINLEAIYKQVGKQPPSKKELSVIKAYEKKIDALMEKIKQKLGK